MNLIVDIGNSRVKAAVMDLNRVIWSGCVAELSELDIELLKGRFDLQRSILCSTRGDMSEAAAQLRQSVGHCLLFDESTPIPIANSYSTPETLGRDRLAAAVGAREISTAENQLIIDMGTAITIDLVTGSGGFEGGTISPGVMIRLRALHDYTAALPLCEPTEQQIDVARSTKEAIEQGVMRGVEYEVRGHIAKMMEKWGEIDIIFCGGDAKYFDIQIKNTIFAPNELIFVGLNRILEYNAG
ncbi:MAG: type III pantothenate kinase [Rikenellaceae bacterium]